MSPYHTIHPDVRITVEHGFGVRTHVCDGPGGIAAHIEVVKWSGERLRPSGTYTDLKPMAADAGVFLAREMAETATLAAHVADTPAKRRTVARLAYRALRTLPPLTDPVNPEFLRHTAKAVRAQRAETRRILAAQAETAQDPRPTFPFTVGIRRPDSPRQRYAYVLGARCTDTDVWVQRTSALALAYHVVKFNDTDAYVVMDDTFSGLPPAGCAVIDTRDRW